MLIQFSLFLLSCLNIRRKQHSCYDESHKKNLKTGWSEFCVRKKGLN
uniref:Uncharacterized protein n=1 Tax=Anguilla anguilla TaxID=7936 RepID=A0A0E9X0E1_ANGAN